MAVKQKFITWSGFHPALVPTRQMLASGASRAFSCRCRINSRGIASSGRMTTLIKGNKITLRFSRKGHLYSVSAFGLFPSNPVWDVVAFVQRGGHGPSQAIAMDKLISCGMSCALFSPQLDNFTTRADCFPARYLDETGFTRNPVLPTDPGHPLFLVSLMAMTCANWKFFLACTRAKLVISDSKSEAAALALAVRQKLNPRLKVGLIAYMVFDQPSPRPFPLPADTAGRLKTAGLEHFGIPCGLQFMQEKVNAVKNQPGAVIIHKSFKSKSEVLDNARRQHISNVIALPQLGRTSDRPSGNFTPGLHVLRMNSSLYLQGREIVSLFTAVAKIRPGDSFVLIARPDQTSHLITGKPPANFSFAGWMETHPELMQPLGRADTLWTHGGNRPSVIEAVLVNRANRKTVPLLFPQDRFTPEVARFWSTKPFSQTKLLAIMMALETETERQGIFHTITGLHPVFRRLVVDPASSAPRSVSILIDRLPALRHLIHRKLKTLRIASKDLYADTYLKIIQNPHPQS